MYRADSIKKIIETGSYPYKIKFFTEEKLPSHRVYPCVEIVNVRPESERKSYDTTEEINSFEVRVYIRYNRTQELETADLYTVENQVISLLKSANISDKLEITSSFEWSRGQINNNKFKIHGIQSTLTVTITEKKSTSGDGTLGGDTTISIGDIEELQNISILGITGNDGKNYSEDTPNGTRILTENNPNGSLFVEIELTNTINPKLKEIFNADDSIPIIINQGGITDNVIAYPVSIEWVVQYDQINRRVLHFELK